MNYTFITKKGDTGKPLTAVLSDENGPINLAAAFSSVKLRMFLSVGAVNKINNQPCVFDPDQTANRGKLSYTFAAADVNVAGDYLFELVATKVGAIGGAGEITFPAQERNPFGRILILDSNDI